MRAVLALALVAALAGCAAPTATVPGVSDPAAHPEPGLPITPGMHNLVLQVQGEPAFGLFGIPDNGSADALLVVAKGIASTLDDLRPVLESYRQQGFLVLGMDFRGPHHTWKVRTGVTDTVAATLAVQAAHPVERTVLYGISLGGQIGALALTAAPPGTYTDFVDGAGYSDFTHAWAEQVSFRASIEAEAGGDPTQAPQAYADLSPLHHVTALAATGVERVHLVHALADTVVPARESEAYFTALGTAGVPATYYSVVAGEAPYICAPAVVICPARLPAGVANHEAAWQATALEVVRARLVGEPQPSETHLRIATDDLTGAQIEMPSV